MDAGEQAATIAARIGLPVEQVSAVLEVEFEHLVVLGIAAAPGHAFRFYDVEERTRLAPSDTLDTARVARDAHRLAGVPLAVAERVLDAEAKDLAARNLLRDEPP